MTEDDFWKMIEKQVKVDEEGEVLLEGLEEALSQQSPDEIVEFQKRFDDVYLKSYTQELWGAAYLINGGCSDDGFDYFRGWLIAQGRVVFERALDNPDSLADVAKEDVECEDVLNLAAQAHEKATGKELPVSGLKYPKLGEQWDFDDDDEMRRCYPRLRAKFC